uniref:Uncharacterized protein n=1 Tax=Romanomermis culicivorax TaxID=13658 RepID=A0A915JR14_ROMCU
MLFKAMFLKHMRRKRLDNPNCIPSATGFLHIQEQQRSFIHSSTVRLRTQNEEKNGATGKKIEDR